MNDMKENPSFENDLAISAVIYDTLLVTDLIGLLAPRLRRAPVWTAAPVIASRTTASPLDENVSRVALVLLQRIWGHDVITGLDAEVLRDRAGRNPRSVVAVSLDGEPVPEWMAQVRQCDLATLGVDRVAGFVLDAISDVGGQVVSSPTETSAPAGPVSRWPDPPVPYLGQTRAHGALRRELDLLVTELERHVEDDEVGGDRVLELHAVPNRTVARIDDVGVSFSWVPARSGSVADGRLMVIEWSGIVGAVRRGAASLKTAHPVRECVYIAEAADADHWCWRAEGPHGRASSTAHLVGEWFAGASMAARQPEPVIR